MNENHFIYWTIDSASLLVIAPSLTLNTLPSLSMKYSVAKALILKVFPTLSSSNTGNDYRLALQTIL